MPETVTGEPLAAVVADRDRLLAAIRKHHAQRADDRCHLDDEELYAAAGLPPADTRVGDKAAMLKNCERFLERRCAGGHWPTYAELEAIVLDADRLLEQAGFGEVPAFAHLERLLAAVAGRGYDDQPPAYWRDLASTFRRLRDRTERVRRLADAARDTRVSEGAS